LEARRRRLDGGQRRQKARRRLGWAVGVENPNCRPYIATAGRSSWLGRLLPMAARPRAWLAAGPHLAWLGHAWPASWRRALVVGLLAALDLFFFLF
jgi:hypothetical protein